MLDAIDHKIDLIVSYSINDIPYQWPQNREIKICLFIKMLSRVFTDIVGAGYSGHTPSVDWYLLKLHGNMD